MMRFLRLAVLLLVVGCTGAWFRPGSGQFPYTPPSTGQVSICGTQLCKDGTAWVPKGLSNVQIVAAPAYLKGVYANAQLHAGSPPGSTFLNAAHTWGADTLRFQVSQYSLAVSGPLYTAPYLAQVVTAIRTVRTAGFVVIISMQHQSPSGYDDGNVVPDSYTTDAWEQLAPYFKTDSGVMFEPYNEPYGGTSPGTGQWQTWQSSFNSLISAIRSTGAQNVLIVDCARAGKLCNSSYTVTDSLNKTIYGIHPYPENPSGFSNISTSDWDANWGTFCTTGGRVCLATEWATSSNNACYALPGPPTSPQLAHDLLVYLQAKNIGIVAWPFDYTGGLVTSWSYAPSAFTGFSACDNSGHGPGLLLQQYWSTGVVPNPPP